MADPAQMGMSEAARLSMGGGGGGKGGAMGMQNGLFIGNPCQGQGLSLSAHTHFLNQPFNHGGLGGFDTKKKIMSGLFAFLGDKFGAALKGGYQPINPPSLPVAGMGSGAGMGMA
jgi:hypothetical protein